MGMSADQFNLARMYLDDAGSSAIQSIQLENATGGVWTISFNGQTTSAIAWNAGSNVIQNALTALSNIGLGNLEVANSPTVPGSVFFPLYFLGTLANTAQPMVTVDTSELVGIGVLALVSQIVAGGLQTFSDAELNLFYNQAVQNFFLAIAYAFRALQAPSAKFNDYTAGQTQEKKSQINTQIKELADYYQEWAFAASQVQIVQLQQVPPRVRAVPRLTGVPSTSLDYSSRTSFPRRNRGGF